jgi:predicted acetyltransferase
MTATSFLARPSAAYIDSYLEALREGFHIGLFPPLGEDAIADIAVNFDAHLKSLDHDGQSPFEAHGRLLPSVPSTLFWLIDQGEFIGAISIRARIDTHVLAHFAGHLGYGIRPSKRRLGYATRQLALALTICRGMGIGIVRVSCGEDNIGSRRAIEANGGVFLHRGEPAWYVDQPFLMYEIPLV